MADLPDIPPAISVHPAAQLLPELSEKQRAALQEDIRKNGLRVPIIINPKGQILDGRHRYLICVALGIKPPFEIRDIPDDEVIALVLSINAQRRHLSTTQRAAVACDVIEHRPANLPVTQEDIAKYFTISVRTLRDAIAIKQASPQLHTAMRADRLSLNAARPILRLPESERSEAVSRLLGCGNNTAARKVGKLERTRATKLEKPELAEWNLLLLVLKNVVHLSAELRQIPERLGEQSLSVTHARELTAALRPILKMDYADLVAAGHEAIAVLATIVNDQPIQPLPVRPRIVEVQFI